MQTGLERAHLPGPLWAIADSLRAKGGRLYLVGGWVRDFLLGRPSLDFDLEVYGLEMERLFKILLPFGKPNLVGKAFGVITLRIEGRDYDFAFPRTESKSGSGHRGFLVHSDPGLTFEKASSRRDFTVNAMGISLPEGDLVDCHGGHRDLKDKVLRHVSEAFAEDPLRVLRGVQFAARFEFAMAEETKALCRTLPLQELPQERIFGEFKKLLLQAKRPSIGFALMRDLGLLSYFPELKALVGVEQDPEWHPEGDVWTHTLMVVDEAARIRDESQFSEQEDPSFERLALMLGALCHDLGKPGTTVRQDGRWRSPAHDVKGEEPTRSFLARLTRESALVELVVALVREHLRPALLHKAKDELGPGAIRRLALRVDIEKLIRVAKADHFGRTTPEALAREFPAGDWLLEQSRSLNVLKERPKPYLSGKFLLSLGMPAGPAMGRLIGQSFELQLEGVLKSPEEAEAWAREKVRAGPQAED